MANFNDINQNLIPQLKAVITASLSLKNNSKFKKLLEVKYNNSIFFRNNFVSLRLYLLLVII
jgi:hypothetical protein